MDVTLAVLCDYANATAEGKLNILGVFTEVYPPVVPFALPQAFLVVSFSAPPIEAQSQKQIRIALVDTDGVPVFSIENPLVVPPPPGPGKRSIFNLVLGMAGLVFPRAGDYAVEILVGGDHKASIPVKINHPPGQELANHD